MQIICTEETAKSIDLSAEDTQAGTENRRNLLVNCSAMSLYLKT